LLEKVADFNFWKNRNFPNMPETTSKIEQSTNPITPEFSQEEIMEFEKNVQETAEKINQLFLNNPKIKEYREKIQKYAQNNDVPLHQAILESLSEKDKMEIKKTHYEIIESSKYKQTIHLFYQLYFYEKNNQFNKLFTKQFGKQIRKNISLLMDTLSEHLLCGSTPKWLTEQTLFPDKKSGAIINDQAIDLWLENQIKYKNKLNIEELKKILQQNNRMNLKRKVYLKIKKEE